jgi:hypothetical protein
MVRRKGELSPSAMDRDWPHQVIMPAVRSQMWLGRWPSMCPRHHSVIVNDCWHTIYCFSDPAEAEDFRKTFQAERFDPKRRRGTGGWASVKPAKP